MPRGGTYTSLPNTNDLDHEENRNDTPNNNSTEAGGEGRGTPNPSDATGGRGRDASLPIAELQGGASSASFTVPGPEGSPPDSKKEGGKGKGTPTGAHHAEAGGGKGRAVDLTSGLPTAEGVFVGAPVDQSSLYHSGGGGSHHQATVITSGPPAYRNSHGAAGSAATVATSTAGVANNNPSHTVIMVNNPGYGEWGRVPQPFACRACGFSGYSHAVQVSTVFVTTFGFVLLSYYMRLWIVDRWLHYLCTHLYICTCTAVLLLYHMNTHEVQLLQQSLCSRKSHTNP